MILIRVGSRTKAVPVPEGFSIDQIEVSISDAADVLHDLKISRPLSEKTRGVLRSMGDRRKVVAKEAIVKVQAQQAEDRALDEADIAWLVSRLTPDQSALWERLSAVLGFVRAPSQGAGLRLSAADWIRRTREGCPEPWTLDWAFLRAWLVSPMSMASRNEMGAERLPLGKLHGIRRAITIKKFAEAWAEQKGPIATAPAEESRVARGSNHPFAILREAIRSSRLRTKEDFFRALVEYRDASVITPPEYEEGKRAFATGTWFGLAIPFPVV